MRNGITGLRAYQQGGLHTKEENRRRAMAGERGYASIGPRPSWAERIAAQVKSVPRRINRALQPETAEGTAALVGASMAPLVGEGIDIADIVAGMRTGDIPRMGWGALGLALPLVAGSTLRRVAQQGARRIAGPALRIKVSGEDMIITSPHGRTHMQVLNDQKKYDRESIYDKIGEMKEEGALHSDIFGFVDSEGKFLVPDEAGAVAYDAGQLSHSAALRRSSPVTGSGSIPSHARDPSRFRQIEGQDRWFHDLWSEDLLPDDVDPWSENLTGIAKLK